MLGDVDMWVKRIDALSIRMRTQRDVNVPAQIASLLRNARTQAIGMVEDGVSVRLDHPGMVEADRDAVLDAVGPGPRSPAVDPSGPRAGILGSFATTVSTAARGRVPGGR